MLLHATAYETVEYLWQNVGNTESLLQSVLFIKKNKENIYPTCYNLCLADVKAELKLTWGSPRRHDETRTNKTS